MEKVAKAMAKCAAEVIPPISKLKSISLLSFKQASTYGKCIVADYNAVCKDKCLTEFLRLKECYIVSCRATVRLRRCADLSQGCFEDRIAHR